MRVLTTQEPTIHPRVQGTKIKDIQHGHRYPTQERQQALQQKNTINTVIDIHSGRTLDYKKTDPR